MSQNSNADAQSPLPAMRGMVRKIAGYQLPGESVERQIERVMHAMNADGAMGRHAVTYRTAYAYWYADLNDHDKDVPSRHWLRAVALTEATATEEAIRAAEAMARVANENLVRLPCAQALISDCGAAA